VSIAVVILVALIIPPVMTKLASRRPTVRVFLIAVLLFMSTSGIFAIYTGTEDRAASESFQVHSLCETAGTHVVTLLPLPKERGASLALVVKQDKKALEVRHEDSQSAEDLARDLKLRLRGEYQIDPYYKVLAVRDGEIEVHLLHLQAPEGTYRNKSLPFAYVISEQARPRLEHASLVLSHDRFFQSSLSWSGTILRLLGYSLLGWSAIWLVLQLWSLIAAIGRRNPAAQV
jgi:hypothetical protein